MQTLISDHVIAYGLWGATLLWFDAGLAPHALKTCLRKVAERTMEGLHRCVRSYIRVLDPAECISYFRHSGYEPL
jgi:hypothetical protein